MDEKKKKVKKTANTSSQEKKEKPVTVHITNHNTFQKGVGAFVTNLNHLTIVMDSEGNMKMDASQVPTMPHTQVDVEQSPEEEEQPDDEIDDDSDPALAVVGKCFIFTSDFVKEKTEAVVRKYYKGSYADLALIEIVLFDHGQLKKRNTHTAFVKSLMAWGILNTVSGNALKQITDGIRDKHSRLPKEGYKEWDQRYLNDKNTCINIGKDLDSMPYIRKKEA